MHWATVPAFGIIGTSLGGVAPGVPRANVPTVVTGDGVGAAVAADAVTGQHNKTMNATPGAAHETRRHMSNVPSLH
jgi:hypothetical protein